MQSILNALKNEEANKISNKDNLDMLFNSISPFSNSSVAYSDRATKYSEKINLLAPSITDLKNGMNTLNSNLSIDDNTSFKTALTNLSLGSHKLDNAAIAVSSRMTKFNSSVNTLNNGLTKIDEGLTRETQA